MKIILIALEKSFKNQIFCSKNIAERKDMKNSQSILRLKKIFLKFSTKKKKRTHNKQIWKLWHNFEAIICLILVFLQGS